MSAAPAPADLDDLPEIDPHVSVRDEDSFAKPVALPEINPHVSIRDEDSFAKPVALPEIDPHVSVRDEDSFAKPVPLPEINPHVSVRDEDSFAKPLPLPEINPHVSIGEEASSFPEESHVSRGAPSIEEAQPPAGEPAYVKVSVDGKKEKTFVQEYMGLSSSGSVVSPRVEDEPCPFASQRVEDELRPVISTRVHKFDEPRPVTKPKVHDLKESRLIVNFPVQDKPSVVPPPVENTPMPVANPPIQKEPRPGVTPRVKVLDESQVLPSEASFATAIPNDIFGGNTHSPLEEFRAKTNLSLKTLMLATLLVASIVGVSALVILEATTGIFSSSEIAGSSESGSSESARPEVLNSAKTVSPPVGIRPPKQESQAIAPPREYSKFPTEGTTGFPSEAATKFPREGTRASASEKSTSDLSRKARSNDVRGEKPEKQSGQSTSRATAREANKNSASSRNLRPNEDSRNVRGKDSVARKKVTDGKKSDVNKAHNKTAARRTVPAKDDAGVKIKVEVRTTPTNGAQRPRTVTRS